MNLENYFSQRRRIVDRALLKYLPKAEGQAAELISAMRYSVLAGGKRIRPVLMLAIADMFGTPYKKIMPAACAIEYAHTSTLILDDLPCMDDSSFRRGRQSVHKKFGESTAILAAYSLMALSFKLLVQNPQTVKLLSQSIGASGVCAGQFVDLKSGSKKIDIKTLMYLHEHKTADLFVSSCLMAGHICGARPAQLKALGGYAKYLGLAFQAYDDILSVEKTEKELGKQTKKDKDSPNIARLFGQRNSEIIFKRYADTAERKLKIFRNRSEMLSVILRHIIERRK